MFQLFESNGVLKRDVVGEIVNSIKTEGKDPIQTIITTTDVLNVEQSGLILNNADVETHKLELSWNT